MCALQVLIQWNSITTAVHDCEIPFLCSSRDYSAPVNFISAGLRKAAAEEVIEEDSDEDEKPVKQEEFPKEFVPKKLKTVSYS